MDVCLAVIQDGVGGDDFPIEGVCNPEQREFSGS